MTAVVGLVAPDSSVYLMSDSAASNDSGIWVQKDQKLIKKGEFILGITGSFRGRDILASRLQLPAIETDLDSYMRWEFVDSVKLAFKDGGFLAHFNVGHDKTETGLLVGVRGRLFGLRSDYSIGEPADGYLSIGSGSPEAQGAMYASCHMADPLQRLTMALRAAEHFNGGTVRAPFWWLKTEPVNAA